jgi:hypothetical protein
MRGDRILASILQPLEPALNDPLVTDVVVNRPHRVAVRKAGAWHWLDVPSFDFQTLDAATILIGQRTGKEKRRLRNKVVRWIECHRPTRSRGSQGAPEPPLSTLLSHRPPHQTIQESDAQHLRAPATARPWRSLSSESWPSSPPNR